MSDTYIPATPYAKLLAKENKLDIREAARNGRYGEVLAKDVLALLRRAGRATPLARRMAEAMGLELSQIDGTGYAGKVCKADVLAISGQHGAVASAQAPVKAQREKITGIRRIIAQRMLQSHTEIPPVTHVVRNDVTALLEARNKLNSSGGRKYSINDFILKAVVKALISNPHMLVGIDGDDIIHKGKVNLGMAVAIDAGLIVPVIHGAGNMSLDDLSETAADLVARARTNKLSPDEYTGNTFTVTNLGMYEVESFTPIINQPDAAILGVCCITDELALNGGVAITQKIMRTCLTYDHRLLDGVSAARFQLELKRLLENPIEIVM